MNAVETIKCAVCDWEIKDAGVKVKVIDSEKELTVCCDECAEIVKDREQILKHIHGLFQSFMRKDFPAIRSGHTTDWKGFQVGSRQLVRGIDQYMEAAQQAIRTFNGTRYELLDTDIQVHGDLGIVFYLAKYYFDAGSGAAEQSILIRSVDIYRREAQRWNQSGSNICTISES